MSVRSDSEAGSKSLRCKVNGKSDAFALVDADDFALVNQFTWHVDDGGYVRTGKTRLHRFLLCAPDGVEVDHINHDLLDNRRSNLRLCSRSENQSNKRPSQGRAFKGVYEHSKSGFEAKLGVRGESVYLGLYRTPEAAAVAHDIAAKALHGKFAWLNFPAKETPSLASILKDAASEVAANLEGAEQ